MQSNECTHISIADRLGAEWEAAAASLGEALATPARKRGRERFGMALNLREALTRFVRISKPDELEAFRRAFPDFFPREFWDSWAYTPDIPGSRPMPFWGVWRRLLKDAWRTGFHAEYVIQLGAVALHDGALCELPEFGKLRCVEIKPVHDFQRAMQAMGASPWRAKFCARCGEPFAADKPVRRYCSDECLHDPEAAQARWRARWEKFGKKWRESQQRKRGRRARVAGRVAK